MPTDARKAMTKDDYVVWEAWGALQQYAEYNPEAPQYLRDMVKGYKERIDAVRRPHVPYPEFCRHPDKCVCLSSCPRDPNCCE